MGKLNLLFKENIIEMEDISIPMRTFPTRIDPHFSIPEIMYIEILEEEFTSSILMVGMVVA